MPLFGSVLSHLAVDLRLHLVTVLNKGELHLSDIFIGGMI